VWALDTLLRKVNSNNLGAVYETGHFACQRTSLVEAAEMLGKRIFYVHASDSQYTSEDHLELGKGLIDWPTVLAALEKQGFNGVFGLDIGGNPQMRDALDGMYTRSKTFLEAALVKTNRA
jgi:sugar phosphate isomerase/epimerase